MSPRPLIFISAVSRELRSARQLVANTLTFLGYDPIWQDIFETSEGDLPGVLRKQISRCNGVVQLVGCCYGAEPPQPTEEFGRVSYTQYEALYARKIGKKVWYLFLDEHFPSDACVDEPDELRALQTAYRNRLKADTHLYHPLTTLEGLEASVLKLRGDLMQLRKGVKRWAAGVAILLLTGLAANFWLLHWQRHTSQQMTETRQAVTSVGEQMTKLREGIVQYIQVEGRIREGQTEPGLVRDQVYEQLGKQMNINVELLREKLPQAAEQLKDAPTASLLERASAAYVTNDYHEAERLAVQAAIQTRNATPTNNADVIRALRLAGFAAQKQIKYAAAMAHLREAAELTNRDRDPGQWAEIQHAIADVLIDQGQYRQAATVLQGALEARASAFGPEHPDTLRSRNRLAYALWRQGRYRDAEGEFRKLIAVEERLLGAQHPETLASENGLANALDDEGKHGDAESEHRHVLELRSKVLGPENPETLKSRNNLALALNRQQKYAQAEKQFRELITVEERVLGPEHPETLRSRRNLLVAIGNQGRHAEAETGFRALLAVQERVLGPEHPDTLGVRNNIGNAVAQQEHFADAEAQFRDVIKIEAKVLGPEHPATLNSRMALARVLSEQQKFGEADAQCREVIALEENVLGPDHPTTISSWYAFAHQLARQNKTEEALQFARKAATAAERSLGQDDPDTRKYAQLVQELDSHARTLPEATAAEATKHVGEYTAAEAPKHIGETATVVGKVGCVDAGRTFHCLPLDGCMPNSPFWIIVNDDASGPELNVNELKGVTIAVSGKIERPQTQPWLVVKSTTQIVPRTKLNPDYLGRARQKESQGDLDGAIAEFDYAIELNHESTAYIERAEVHVKKGDLDGAISDYDQLIERYPEGVYYLKRGRLKMRKTDYAGVVADSSRAIELLARYYASHPNDHSTFILAQAYSERGEAREAMGDPAGAIPDYENAVKNDRAPIYKEKLRTAKAEAAAKKVAITQPTAQSAQNEQSFNESEVTPESIAEAFVQAYSGAAVDAVAGLYGDRVDHTNSGVISNAAIRKQSQEYFARWPVRHWSLLGTVNTVSLGTSKKKVVFSANYDASNPQTNKHVSGIARETLIVASDANGAMKIVSQREQTSKRGSGQPGKETSQGLGPNAVDDQHANGGTLDEFMGDVTGTVVYADEKRGYIEIDRGKHDGRGNFEVVLTGDLHTPKVGEKVSVHWYSCGGGSIHVSNRDRPHCADKIEKVGNAEAGFNRENSAATQQEFDPGSYFRLTTKWQGDAKSLDIVNDGKNNNRPILANTGNFSGQYWKIAPVGDGYYRLTTKWQGTAKSLDVVSDGKNNNQLILAKTGNYSGQYWKITPVGDGYYRLTTQSQGAGKSLDIVNDGTNNNQPILAHTGNYSGQFWKFTAAAFSLAQAEIPEKLKSPDGKYSIEVVRGTEDSLVLSHGGEVIARVPTSVGPAGSLFEALWSADGSYVAVNKQRSSRTGGDSMWILALPTGKVLRKPDDAFWNELEERAGAYIDEKHLSETKVSLTLIATGWEKGGLRFRLEAWFGEMEFSYFFDGTVEPLNLRMINDWKVSTANPISSGNGEKPADSAIKQKLLGYWSSPRHGYHIAPDGIIYMCPRKYATTTNHWAVKDGKFYWDSEPHEIVTLNDKKFVYREIGGYGTTFTLIRGTKEKVDPE